MNRNVTPPLGMAFSSSLLEWAAQEIFGESHQQIASN
jgi:hypothetical protein